MTNGQDDWIRRYRAAPEAAVQLVCLPHAGGSASYFRPMAMALFPAAEVLAVQYPGRQDRVNEPCIGDFAELTERTLAAIRPELGRPVALFGHSMGALLAFEVAKRLEADGIVPLALFASGARPPCRPLPRHAHTATDEELIAELAALDGTDERLLDNEDMRVLVLSALRADYRMLESYRCDSSTVACPVVSLTGDNDAVVSIDDAAAWASHTAGRFDLHVFPGGHFYLDDHWDGVGEVLTKQLGAHVPTRTG
ncbi:thioesterase II family protein [Streptomyces atratus]|uniref:thioesterase II family protein n=1 Tax=Streptomyces atratus TaxID=1893 RepID=UPI002252EDDF|nr:alpha/beta fold hydrolase [Streptomyces atratus]MCX5345156.1 alpha/beta fold hydrolase [Streptomyces atratus]